MCQGQEVSSKVLLFDMAGSGCKMLCPKELLGFCELIKKLYLGVYINMFKVHTKYSYTTWHFSF